MACDGFKTWARRDQKCGYECHFLSRTACRARGKAAPANAPTAQSGKKAQGAYQQGPPCLGGGGSILSVEDFSKLSIVWSPKQVAPVLARRALLQGEPAASAKEARDARDRLSEQKGKSRHAYGKALEQASSAAAKAAELKRELDAPNVKAGHLPVLAPPPSNRGSLRPPTLAGVPATPRSLGNAQMILPKGFSSGASIRPPILLPWAPMEQRGHGRSGHGLGPTSWQILATLGAGLKQVTLRYVVCSGFKMLPETLAGSERAEAAGAARASPSRATCTNSYLSAGRCIDFFVVSKCLHWGARAEILVDDGTAPRFPVALKLKQLRSTDSRHAVANVPKGLPVDIPVGCRRAAPARVLANLTTGRFSINTERHSLVQSFVASEALALATFCCVALHLVMHTEALPEDDIASQAAFECVPRGAWTALPVVFLAGGLLNMEGLMSWAAVIV
ncbi:unnamed protein product [Prorocentrum cordatum]|uniref:Uncharacterized protein n=1 Tax=Prorocentrum cordatum TaxID=2364126 RepID=A0ABN9UMJ3_9DINO|nr:unnamed protein product [Polarella glacialis]